MAQITDVMHALVVFDAARQELAWAYSGTFTVIPMHLKGAVDTISKVLSDAEMQWVTSTISTTTRLDEEVVEEEVVQQQQDDDDEEEEEEQQQQQEHVEVQEEHQQQEVVQEEQGKGADTLSIGEEEIRSIREWLMRVKNVAYDMRAVAKKDLLQVQGCRIDDKQSPRWLPCLPRTTSRSTPTIEDVAEKLDELKKKYEMFGYTTGLPLATTTCTDTEHQPCSGRQEETAVPDVLLGSSMDDDKQRIIDIITDHLGDNDAPLFILPIFGPPCVGKTTLARSVFHDPTLQDCCVEVRVDMPKRWGSDQIKEINTYISGKLQQVAGGVSETKKKVLLLFDDLVEVDYCRRCKPGYLRMLDNLSKDLLDSRRQAIAVVTTTSKAVAEHMCGTRTVQESYRRHRLVSTGTVEPYRLHPISDQMCREIIKRPSDLEARTAGNQEGEEASVLDEMDGPASKCSGLPLAAKALGRFLLSVDPQERVGFIREDNPDIWNVRGGFSRDSQLPLHSITVFTNLKRSSHLGPESWLSFAFCAFGLPTKGNSMARVMPYCDLLNQWCCLGITTHKQGASCIRKLLDRSLLREKPASTTSSTLLTMDDLMYDFARYLLGDRLIVVDGKDGATLLSSDPVNNAHLALVSNLDVANKQLDIASKLPAGILALWFEDCREMELSEDEFAGVKYSHLRLLDLSGCCIKKFPPSIRHLKHLRYLKAPGIQDEQFPRPIVGLLELRYLNLHGSCSLPDLTEAFDRLQNLSHLDLSGCSGLKTLPDEFGRLWRLEHLDLSACSGLQELPWSFPRLRGMTHLNLAGCLGLDGLPSFCFEKFRRLCHLDLSGCSRLKALPHFMYTMGLTHLILSGCWGLETLPDGLGWALGLKYLDLSACSRLEKLPSAINFKSLTHLNLSGCLQLKKLSSKGRSMLSSEFERSKLRHLDMSGCSGLELDELPMESLPRKLQHLNLSGCSKLKALPDLQARDGSSSELVFVTSELLHLNLSGLSSLQELPRSFSQHKRLVHLNLSGCSVLKQLPEDCSWTRQLQHLDLSACASLQGMPHDDDFEERKPFQKLQYLDLSGCFSLVVPDHSGIVRLVDNVRRKPNGRASGPRDASLKQADDDQPPAPEAEITDESQ